MTLSEISSAQEAVRLGIIRLHGMINAFRPDNQDAAYMIREASRHLDEAAKLYGVNLPEDCIAVDDGDITLDALIDEAFDLQGQQGEISAALYGLDRDAYGVADDIDGELILAEDALREIMREYNWTIKETDND